MLRVLDMKATGRMTSSMGSESKSGMKAVNMRADTLWARKKDKANTLGLTDPLIVVNGLITELMGKEYTCGKTAVNIMENGSITIWRATVSITGQMAADMRDSITMIRNAASASTIGRTAANMKAGGIRASSMASVHTWTRAKRRLNSASGKGASVLSGSMSRVYNRYLKINLTTQHFSRSLRAGGPSNKTPVSTDLQDSTQVSLQSRKSLTFLTRPTPDH